MENILEVQNLKTYFHTRNGVVKAVDGVSFEVKPGETLGIVGESGSGKSVTMMSILGLIPSPPGKIEGGKALFKGQDLLQLDSESLRKIRGNKISMIFQDPMTSLNPYLKISTQMIEPLQEHGLCNSYAEGKEKALETLRLVGIPDVETRIDQYPHQFSGGMRQRIMIAMALITDPDILIADEPTTALDVTIQAQILELLSDLQKQRGMSIILITHDLGVIAGMADQVLVMYAGKPCERGSCEDIFYHNQHPYTHGLLASIPTLNSQELYSIPGLPPDTSRLKPGCTFASRCNKSMDICRSSAEIPQIQRNPNHQAYCHLASTTQPEVT